MSTPLIDIRPADWQIVRTILEKHAPSYEVWAFGSRARWETKDYSDLDLAIITDHPLSLDVKSALDSDFAESDLPFKVDVVDWATATPSFREIIQREKVVVREGKKKRGPAGKWRETTLDQLGRIVTGKTPPSSREDCFGGDIPFVTPTDFDGRRTIDSTGRYLTEEGADSVGGSRISGRAVMVSCIGSDMGKAAVAGSDCVTNQQINSIVVTTDDDPLFVYYNLSHRKAEIRIAAGGSAQPILNKSAFGKLDILLPPPNEQRAIAHILGTLDDKIELNCRMNETLEAMARAIFRSWFVDFDPVRAKMEGRPAGLPPEIEDLFPDEMVDSELGEIPKGWRCSKIGEEVTACGGSTPSTKEPEFWEDGHHHWTTPKDLSELAFPVLLDTERKITDAGLSEISSGLLPVGTVLLSSRAPIGYLAIAEIPTAINQGFIAMRCDGILPNVFVLFWCRENMDVILGNANGSTFQEISKSNFRLIPAIVPSKLVLSAFRQIVVTLYRQIVENERESRLLASLRDLLLPKLISGKLRVKDGEKFIGYVL